MTMTMKAMLATILASVLLVARTASAQEEHPAQADTRANAPALRAARAANLVLTSGLATWFFVESVGYTPAKNSLDASAYAHDEQKLNKSLGVVAPVLMASTIVSDLPVLWLERRRATSAPFVLTAAGTALNIASVITTFAINVPANDAIASWNADAPPSDWQSVRNRWETGASVRMALTMGALACQVVAALLE